jgi:release factor glutamine methyltransferase
LKPGGLLALEIGEGQAEGVVELVDEAGAYEDTTVHRDLAGRKRMVTARKATGRADNGG